MKALRLAFSLLALLAWRPSAHAQVVVTTPTYFRDTDQVTLTFDAAQGNAGLKDYTGPVYIYTGLITDQSTSNSDWKHVKSGSFNQADPAAQLTALGNNKYSITLTPRTFYPNVGAAEKILKLAMVFRSADGSKSGRAAGGADIFVDVTQNSNLQASITTPGGTTGSTVLVATGGSVAVTASASAAATLTLSLNGNQVAQQTGATTISATVTPTQAGANTLTFTANDGTTTVADSRLLYLTPAVTTAPLPAGANKDGVTYLAGGTSVVLSLTAPGKQSVFVIGEFNSWQPTAAGFMHRTAETDAANGRWWVQLDGLTPGQEYAYQFLVDGQLRVADPYCEKILSTDDQYIPAVTYPNLKPYPTGQTTGNVSVLQTNQPAYQWQATNFRRPARTNLVVYELLVRDFVARHDYQTITDSLAYLQRLGINAIELMPINEFEGNESWGYNPSFYFAPDKYYGTKTALKQLIDACHQRGIAVIMDMVLNHSFGQSPMVQLYFDGNQPTAASPWFNQTARHPANVGYDFNHESAYTKYFSKQVMQFWLQEYHIDGYRFDLSKGFSQRDVGTTENDATYAAWGQYDAARIAIWKDYHAFLAGVDPAAYPILEHFADRREEQELAADGLMLWGNMNYNYNQATMGYADGWDFSGGYYGSRGFTNPNLVTYMESHDEERLMFRNEQYGNGAGSYNIKEIPTGLKRNEMAGAFFFTVPGPRLLWQFGEVGYDYSINYCPDGTISPDCRVSNKPIRWDYYQQADRRHLYDVWRALIALRTTQPAFAAPTAFTQSLSGAAKSLHVADAELSVTIVGNFGVTETTIDPQFQQAGTWYDYLTGSTLTVTDPNALLTLQPGQYAVYTSRKIINATTVVLPTKAPQPAGSFALSAAPNPAGTRATLHYTLSAAAPTVTLTVQNLLGATVRTVAGPAHQAAGAHELTLPVQNLANGVYLLRLRAGAQQQTTKLVVQH